MFIRNKAMIGLFLSMFLIHGSSSDSSSSEDKTIPLQQAIQDLSLNNEEPFTEKNVEKSKTITVEQAQQEDTNRRNLISKILSSNKIVDTNTVSIVKNLIDKDIKISSQDKNGDTALHHLFVPKGKKTLQPMTDAHYEIAQALLASTDGVQLAHIENKLQETPLLTLIKGIYSSGFNNSGVKILNALIKAGTDPNASEENKLTPLYMMAELADTSEKQLNDQELSSNSGVERRFIAGLLGGLVSFAKPLLTTIAKPLLNGVQSLVGGGGLTNLPIVGNLIKKAGSFLGNNSGAIGSAAQSLVGDVAQNAISFLSSPEAQTPRNRAGIGNMVGSFMNSMPIDDIAIRAIEAYRKYRAEQPAVAPPVPQYTNYQKTRPTPKPTPIVTATTQSTH